MSESTPKELSLQELPELRRKTEAVSKLLKDQIVAHLETLRPLFAPDRMLGKYAGGKIEATGAERALAELRQNYAPFSGKPYDLPETLDLNWLPLIGNSLELHSWEYPHTVQGKPITMTSPLRWVVNYRTNYTLTQVQNVVAGKEAVRHEYLRQFVVNSLMLALVLHRNPGLVQLFADLRYELKVEAPPDLKKLPVLTITSMLTSFRPADDLIAAAVAFSGIPAFIELLNLETVQSPRDLFNEKLAAALK